MPTPPPSTPSRRSFEFQAFAQLFLVTGLAFGDPILQVFGNDPDAFVRTGVSGFPVVIWALGVLFIPALVLWCVEVVIAGIRPVARMWAHIIFLGIAVSFWLVRLCRDSLDARGAIAIGMAICGGVLFAMAFRRFPGFRRWLLFVCWAPALAFITFVADPAVREIISSSGAVASAAPDSALGSDAPDGTGTDGSTTTAGGSTQDTVFEDAGPRAPDVEIEPLGEFDSDTPVVMVVFDAFPTWALLDGQGEIDENLFPNFAELAATSNWYRNSTTIAPNTQRAVPAILTGVFDDPNKPRTFTAASYPESLFTLLGGSYDMNVFEQVSRVCPVNICAPRANSGVDALIAETIDQWRRVISPSLVETTDAAVGVQGRVEHYYEWLDELKGGSTLNYQHLLLPHDPWFYNDKLEQYDGPESAEGHNVWVWRREESAVLGRQRFILQAMGADRLLGALIDRMKEEGMWEESLLIVTADHGTSFQNHLSQRALDEGNLAQILWQLMMVKTPDQTTGAVSDAQVRTLDIVPTVADVLGITVPWEVDGASVLDPDHPTLETLPIMNDWRPNRTTDESNIIQVDPALFEEVLALSALPPGTISDEYSPYRLGDYGGLVGRKVSDLDTSGAPVPGVVEDAERWDTYDSTAETLPLYVRASFEESNLDQFAVSVNGVIAMTAPTYLKEIWGVVPSDFFVEGKNTVEVYLVQGPADAPTLSKVNTD